MNLLAIETSSNLFSIALSTKGKCRRYTQKTIREQAKLILPTIDKLLTEANIILKQLDAIAIGVGAGSFTGLRVASSVAQGIAFAQHLPVVLISSLRAAAQAAYNDLKTPNILVATNAYMKEIYWGVYQADSDGIMQTTTPDKICSPDDITISKETNWLGIGDAWDVYPNLYKTIDQIDLKIEPEKYPTAEAIAQLAKIEFVKGNTVIPEKALPIYLRKKDAWTRP